MCMSAQLHVCMSNHLFVSIRGPQLLVLPCEQTKRETGRASPPTGAPASAALSPGGSPQCEGKSRKEQGCTGRVSWALPGARCVPHGEVPPQAFRSSRHRGKISTPPLHMHGASGCKQDPSRSQQKRRSICLLCCVLQKTPKEWQWDVAYERKWYFNEQVRIVLHPSPRLGALPVPGSWPKPVVNSIHILSGPAGGWRLAGATAHVIKPFVHSAVSTLSTQDFPWSWVMPCFQSKCLVLSPAAMENSPAARSPTSI